MAGNNGNRGDGQIKEPQNAAGEAAGLREPKWRGQAAGSKGESWLSDTCVCVSVCGVCTGLQRTRQTFPLRGNRMYKGSEEWEAWFQREIGLTVLDGRVADQARST